MKKHARACWGNLETREIGETGETHYGCSTEWVLQVGNVVSMWPPGTLVNGDLARPHESASSAL